MTATNAGRPALRPDPAEIAEFCRQLAGRRDSLYPFVAGYLISVVGGIAAEHRCRKPGCMSCERLRRGLALIAAIDLVDPATTGDAS